jgi:hypothetical protein
LHFSAGRVLGVIFEYLFLRVVEAFLTRTFDFALKYSFLTPIQKLSNPHNLYFVVLFQYHDYVLIHEQYH